MKSLVFACILVFAVSSMACAWMVQAVATNSGIVSFGNSMDSKTVAPPLPDTAILLAVYDSRQGPFYSTYFSTDNRPVWHLVLWPGGSYPGNTANLEFWSPNLPDPIRPCALKNADTGEVLWSGEITSSTQTNPFCQIVIPITPGEPYYYDFVVVPEPSAGAALLAGLAGLAGFIRRRI